MKTCQKCKTPKELTEFPKDYRRPNATKSPCKVCRRIKRASPETKAKTKVSTKAWRQNNPGKVKNWLYDWRRRNPEAYAQTLRDWRERHPEKSYAITKAYTTAHPEKVVQFSHARRARVRAASGKFTSREWMALKDACGHICLCCGTKNKLTADHVIPLARGGSNDISNIQPLCKTCNFKKHLATTDYRLKAKQA